jgi:hypothetical protein
MKRLALIMFSFLSPMILRAGVVTSCGEPQGYAFYQEGGLVQNGKGGWVEDGVTGGRIIVTKEKDAFEILYQDATKHLRSSTEDDGDQIIKVEEASGTLVLLLLNPTARLETYVFKIDGNGRGVLFWSQQKYGDSLPVRKYALFRAVCSK